MIEQGLTTSFKLELMQGVHDVLLGGLKIALYSENSNLGPSTTAYTDVGEVVGSGYTAGGIILLNTTLITLDNVVVLTFDNPVWNAEVVARGALIYNSTPVGALVYPSVAVLDFGADKRSMNGVFEVRFPEPTATSAIIRIS